MNKDLTRELLLEDRWAPVTSEMGFLEMEAEQAARAHAAWQRGLEINEGKTVEVRPVYGTLEQVLSTLLPLVVGDNRRYLFIPTRSIWTAYINNAFRGTDASSAMGRMAEAERCRALRVNAVPHTLGKGKGRYGGLTLELFGPRQTHWLNVVRAIQVLNDGGHWEFIQSGEPFPFENLEQYKAKRVKERFTFEMLKEYLRHLGLSPFDEHFYLPDGAPAWLVEKKGPALPHEREYTLEQARERF